MFKRLSFHIIELVALFIAIVLMACADRLADSTSTLGDRIQILEALENVDYPNQALATITYTDSVPDSIVTLNKSGMKVSMGKKEVKVIDTLKLVAKVTSPSVNGKVLQATDFRKKGTLLYVSYNMAGEIYLGAVQIIDVVKPEEPDVVQTVVFTDSDINSLNIKNDYLYLVGGTSNSLFQSPAFLEKIKLENKKIPNNYTSNIVDLPSFAGTSVAKIKGDIVVSVGALDGGVIFIKNDGNLKNGFNVYTDLTYSFHSLEDARYIDSNNDNVYCVKGTNAGLWKFKRKDGAISNFSLTGATIAESKSTVEISKNEILLGLGDGGVTLFDGKKDKVEKTMAQVIADSLPSTKTVTNAVSGKYKEFYVANGEAGVSVHLFKKGNIDNLASFDLGSGISVNAVRYHKQHLLIAAGLGGLQVVYIERDNDWLEDQEDDWWDDWEDEDDDDDD